MEDVALKIDLIDKIEHAEAAQLKEIYGLITNYFNGQDDESGWDLLPGYRKDRILKSIEQADAGLGTSASEVIRMAREKHGLNG